MGTRYATMATQWARRAPIKWRTIGTLVDYVDKDFEGEVNYHTTAHRALKWSRFIPKVGCKVKAFMS